MTTTRLIYAGAIAGLAVVSAIAGYIIAVWPVLLPQVQGAIIGGAFTVVSAASAASVVFWQLRRQALNTIAANQHNEAMKLKKEVYTEVTEVCREALAAQRALSDFVIRFWAEVSVSSMDRFRGNDEYMPRTCVEELVSKYDEASNKLSNVSWMQERWAIIDPRSSIFGVAFLDAKVERMSAWGIYYGTVKDFFPAGANRRWVAPAADQCERLRNETDLLMRVLSSHESYILDFQNEMQNALLGDLFKGHRVERERLFIDDPVITLDNHEVLRKYFGTKIGDKGKLISQEDRLAIFPTVSKQESG